MNKNHPSTKTPDVIEQAVELEIVRTIQAGFPTYTSFLSQYTKEPDLSFEVRKRRPNMFDAITPQINAASGKILESDIIITSPAFQELATNIDLQGTPLKAFAEEMVKDALWAGHNIIFIDHTRPSTVAKTRRDELIAGARPFWRMIKKDNIRNIQTEIINGKLCVSQMTIQEDITEPDGFGANVITQWRVLRRRAEGATFTIYRTGSTNNGVVISTEETLFQGANKKALREIPVVMVPTRPTGFFTSKPYFMELATLVRMDYLIASDMDHNHFMTSYPLLVTSGEDFVEGANKNTLIGPNARLKLGDGGDAKYISGDGRGVELGMQRLKQLREQMVVSGLRLSMETTSADRETAEAKLLVANVDDVRLSMISEHIQSALNQAITITGQYMNTDLGTLTLPFSFVRQTEKIQGPETKATLGPEAE